MEKNEEIKSAIRDQSVPELPLELWHHIIKYCSIEDLLQLQFVSNSFKSNVGDSIRKKLDSFHSDLELHINKFPAMIQLYENRRITEFDPDIQKKHFISPSNKYLTLLGTVVSRDLLDLLDKRYPIRDYPWIVYNQNDTRVQVRVPPTIKFGYFSTMSIMLCVVGYLFIFDTSDVDSFWSVFRWMDYIMREKSAARESPRHYVVIGYVFADKQRAVHKFQGEYFAQLMGMTYIEVEAEDNNGLDKVWPQMLSLFTVESDGTENEPKPEEKKKKKSQPCKTQ